MLDPRGVAHVGLRAEDLAVLARFYEEALGLRLVERHPHSCFFDLGAGAVLELWSGGRAATGPKTAERQSVRICLRVHALEPAIAALAARGIPALGEIGTYGAVRWVHFADPEGNVFGLTDRST